MNEPVTRGKAVAVIVTVRGERITGEGVPDTQLHILSMAGRSAVRASAFQGKAT